jgi:4-hydroxybenzoate polyprenyltransferase
MIGLIAALIIVGLVLGFFIPPFGFLFAIPGLILLIAFLFGFGRRAAAPDQRP